MCVYDRHGGERGTVPPSMRVFLLGKLVYMLCIGCGRLSSRAGMDFRVVWASHEQIQLVRVPAFYTNCGDCTRLYLCSHLAARATCLCGTHVVQSTRETYIVVEHEMYIVVSQKSPVSSGVCHICVFVQ